MTLGTILACAALLLLPPALMLGTFNGLSLLGIICTLGSVASVMREAWREGVSAEGDEG